MKDKTIHKTVHYMMFVVAVIALMLFPDKSEAEVLKLNLVVVDSPLAIPPEQQIEIFKEAALRTQEVGVTIVYKKIKIVPDIYNQNKLINFASRLFKWSKQAKKLKLKGQTYYLLPPMTDEQGRRYISGMAGAVCTTKRNRTKQYGQVSMQLFNVSNEPRLEASKIAVLHELLHTLGANHAGESKNFQPIIPNVMLPDALRYAEQYLPILPITYKEIGYCRQGLSVLGNR